ncbi:Na/Pi cotransporter family protein [Porcipelethomonas sp.]|uniref:Na/Pi cotransporter family protein n=1 Tax=Porcipelethomonas sp. TaxID=2981675 RepID=UPI003EF19349
MSTSQIIQTFICMFGGVALLLYGMNVLGSGLEKISGGKMEKILEKLTNNIIKAVVLGALVTAVIQSSSATTVIVVGLVNSGILSLSSAVGIIMGANIGTTVTGQILRLGDLEGNQSLGIVMEFLTPTYLAPMLAIIGILFILIAKKDSVKAIGDIGIGLGVLFTGMLSLSEAVEPLSELEAFKNLFASLENPVLGILAGAVVTALIQSSSASIGILQAVSRTGVLKFAAAFPIIMGQNIGTCSTSIISSIGASKNAKRAAVVHLYFNFIGTVLFLICVYVLRAFDLIPFWDDTMNMGDIANFHTVFNIIVTIFFIPFHKVLEKLAILTIRSKPEDDEDIIADSGENMLDSRFLKSPSLAIQYSNNALAYMGKLAKENFRMSCGLHSEYDAKCVEKIREYEDIIDRTEDKLNSYLVSITDCELSAVESRAVTSLLHMITDFERIGDYAINIMESAEIMHEKGHSLSDKAIHDLEIIADAVTEIIDMAITAVEYDDLKTAKNIEPLEETIDQLEYQMKNRHIERLKAGKCAIDRGVHFLDMLSDIERIADHCSNVAVHVLSRNLGKEDIRHHEYIDTIHKGESKEYADAIQEYSRKYKLSTD